MTTTTKEDATRNPEPVVIARPPFVAPDTGLLTLVSRNHAIESWHRGALVVVEGDRVLFSLGDPEQIVFCRSATKPMQALPLLELGVGRLPELNARQLTMLSASHDGTPAHVAVAEELLAKAGLTEADLQCGAHWPFDKKASAELARQHGRPQRTHNNCSGKHAGFLLLSRLLGEEPRHYLDQESRVQQLVLSAVQDICEVPSLKLSVGIDGCGAPTFRMPLRNLARGFARLTNPGRMSSVRAQACRTLLTAVSREPFYLAGEQRLCTALLRSLPDRIYPKNGAEGVYAFGLPGRNIGFAIKVADGNERGYLPVVVDLLVRLGLLFDLPPALLDFLRVPVTNTQGTRLGEVTSAVAWPF